MATRKDLLKAHTFTSQRLINALVSRNPDEQQPPLRRIKTGTLVGALIATLITAGFGVWGLLDPGANKKWKAGGDIAIVDTTSGVSYVYDAESKLLHPTPNVASARLAAGSPSVMKVGGHSLVDEPRGNAVGIPEAPSVLPEEKTLKAFPMRACAGPKNEAGLRPTTLEFASPTAEERDDVPLLLRGRDGTLVLVIDGRGHRLPKNRVNPPAFLTARDYVPIDVSDAFIGALQLGKDLYPLVVEGQGGEPNERQGALRVGDIGSVGGENGRKQWWILQKDGYSRITELDAELLLAEGTKQIPNLEIADVNKYLSSQSELNDDDLPNDIPAAPERVAGDAGVCATWPAAGRNAIVTVRVTNTPKVTTEVRPDSKLADRVVQPPGRGALIQNASTVDAAGTSMLVMDGMAYEIDQEASRIALGFKKAPVRVQSQILSMIPSGLPDHVVLSQAAASHPLP